MTFPVPNPPTRAAGTPLTAAVYEDDITEGVQFLTNPPLFIGTQTSTQSLADSTWTSLTFTTEDADTYSGHSTSSNTSRYTAQRAGWYTVCGVYAAAANSTGFRAVRLAVNGTRVAGTGVYLPNNGSSDGSYSTPTRDVFLAVNDYVEVQGWQNSGGSLNTAVGGGGGELASALWARYSHG